MMHRFLDKKIASLILSLVIYLPLHSQNFYLELQGGGILQNSVYMPNSDIKVLNDYALPSNLNLSGTYFFNQRWGVNIGIGVISSSSNSNIENIKRDLMNNHSKNILIFNEDFYSSSGSIDLTIGATYRNRISPKWDLFFKGKLGLLKYNPFYKISFLSVDTFSLLEERFLYTSSAPYKPKIEASAQITYNLLDCLGINFEIVSMFFFSQNYAYLHKENSKFQSEYYQYQNSSLRALIKIQGGLSIFF